jgi:hypothetical protein
MLWKDIEQGGDETVSIKAQAASTKAANLACTDQVPVVQRFDVKASCSPLDKSLSV